MQTLDSSEDADLELMFAEIRRYPLLTADEEKLIDGRKWHAVNQLSAVFADVAELRITLADVLLNSLECPPEVKRFPSREQHFTLRRELAPYFSDGDFADVALAASKALRDASQKNAPTVYWHKIPASLTVGIAVFMLRRAGGQFPDAVADAVSTGRGIVNPPAPIARARRSENLAARAAGVHRSTRCTGDAQPAPSALHCRSLSRQRRRVP